MNEKRILINVLFTLFLIILGSVLVYHLYWQHSREVAWSAINQYITKQRIAQKAIEVSATVRRKFEIY